MIRDISTYLPEELTGVMSVFKVSGPHMDYLLNRYSGANGCILVYEDSGNTTGMMVVDCKEDIPEAMVAVANHEDWAGLKLIEEYILRATNSGYSKVYVNVGRYAYRLQAVLQGAGFYFASYTAIRVRMAKNLQNKGEV